MDTSTFGSPRRELALVLALVGALAGAPTPGAAQSVLQRSPNMGGTWSGRPGMLYFNFLHRFTDSGPPANKVLSYPTFLLAAGLPARVLAGVRYATNSELVAGVPNEWEPFARWSPVAEAAGAPLDLALLVAYNDAAHSGDGEVTLARAVGSRVRVLGAARFFSNAFDGGESRWALAGGATVRVTRSVALAVDLARLVDLDETEGETAWSAGLQLAIPGTPHTLSLHGSNATTTTLEGASLGVSETRWGFEFTVPLTPSRFLGRRRGGEDGGAS